MDYVIKNYKNVYIRLNENGAAVTCTEHEKTLFEQSKAKNILKCLPKTLQRLNFKVEPILDIGQNKLSLSADKKVIQNDNYIIPDQIAQWVNKFGICDDILKEAQKRKEELIRLLSDADKEFSNMVHKVELEEKIDMYGAWEERNKWRKNRRKRREIKDELLIISNVLKMDFRNLDRSTIDKVVRGLAKRKFTYRVVEEEETENVV
ncbi:hypothetical protein [Romboutsia ilealis]|jgi:hypothetical protein|uniref:hypothetical protein n=1 Tax=Romboutsia ilealis TaxID=1115758 RepID=UPI0026F3849D|nr:hypothetical protein [Romboutsia ilealis]